MATRKCSSIAVRRSRRYRLTGLRSMRDGFIGSRSCVARCRFSGCCSQRNWHAAIHWKPSALTRVLLRALIELLGMRYRPDRFDFGWRYVETELPEPAQRLIERYAFIADAGALRQLSSELAEELMRQLETS
ncbi:MAG: hypothetical protein H0T67_00745 [Burkholderiaceae bacterium]|nr:hypothetical protein [Burkholderiaceae bacterium]